ncbi:hypothetical protein CFIO01_08287 [Colletotrichum fioriniae PJ7]|uniref:Uncharacterized protein n=1 Tax=Colletotrichum fioriniae PJ7 TaxID=1445577 RepID=A0A010QT59_9PEZI|nr:hypothetical protein CFIO01_08287 [Colletotrichum fioriniae PJ7]
MTTPNNNASPPEYYSGLEVDSRPGRSPGGYGDQDLSKFRVADQNNLPEVHNHDGDLPQAVHPYGHDYSMLQAVHPAEGGASPVEYQNGSYDSSGYYAPKDDNPPEVLRSKNLMMSSYNSSTKVWSSTIANRESTIKEGTPISNSLFWHSDKIRDVRIYYLNDANQVAGIINANPVYGSTWDKSGVSNTFTANPKSNLLSNGIYTPDSYLSNLVLYQDAGNTIRVLRRTGDGATDWAAVGISTDFGKPAEGTGMSMIPIYTNATTKRMAMFYTSETGSLIHLTLVNDNDWTNNTLPTTLETNATIAAFSSGYESSNNLVMHVLGAQADKAPVLTTYAEGEWTNVGEISTMSGEDRPFKIAANSAGRVYGLVQRNATKVEIVEWEWIGGTTYNKIGVIDTVS